MDLLILGGTRFLGRAVAAAALERGHRLTLFHRGRSGADLFPQAEHLLGDRDGGLAALGNRRWDAVVDTCGFVPRLVGDAARALAARVGHYTFISSISAYADPVGPGAGEGAPLATLSDPAVEEVSGVTYGGLKAACEGAAEAELPGRVLHVRAGLLVGPHDTTDRFPYWVRRFAAGGDVLVPDAFDQALQLVDARDLAAWIVSCAERRVTGAFNATGPAEATTLGACFGACRAVLGPDARLVPVDEAFLLERGVAPWTGLPLWVPEESGFLRMRIDRALAAGLAFRPLEHTLRDTLAWWEREGATSTPSWSISGPPPASLAPDRERELLAEWRSQGH